MTVVQLYQDGDGGPVASSFVLLPSDREPSTQAYEHDH